MRRFLLALVAIFVETAVLNFVIHGILLHLFYQQTPQLMRAESDASSHTVFLLAGFFFFAVGFVAIYTRGVEAKPWPGQGIRYGFAIWLIASVSRYLIYYAIQPWPVHVASLQIGYELVMSVLLGLTVAAIYRGTSRD